MLCVLYIFARILRASLAKNALVLKRKLAREQIRARKLNHIYFFNFQQKQKNGKTKTCTQPGYKNF